jgi:hypothetical protein
VIKNASDFGQ